MRSIIHDGDFQHETIYVVKRPMEIFLMAQIIEQNGHHLPQEQQLVIPIRFADLIDYGFEFWVD